MKIALIAAGALVVTLIGFLVVGGAAPYITVPPDKLWTVGGYTITNTVFTAWVVIGVLLVVALIVGPRLSLVPSGFSGAVEAILTAFYDMCASVAGEQNARRFFPLVATIFFYVLVANWMGLLPGFKTVGMAVPDYGNEQSIMQQVETPLGSFAYVPLRPDSIDSTAHPPLLPAETAASLGYGSGEFQESPDSTFSGGVRGVLRPVHTDITAPLAIAIFAFIFVEFWGLQSLGFAYLGKFFAFSAVLKKGPLGIIDIFVGLLELVSELSRMISFTFRLFGNMFAGSVLMLMMTFLAPLVLTIPFYGLELFVGAIQAFVFAMLTLVFAVTAVAHHGDDHHVEEHGGAH
jgi:F-type H+-transporting ATPase subunit a